jgi:uncharacterized protein
VLVLLPPSEGKTLPGGRRRPVDLASLSWAGLEPARAGVLAALAAASSRPDAVRLLGVGPSLGAEVSRNTALLTAPAAPAGEVYSGVLFEALGLATLSPAGRRRAARRVVITSALWGAVRPGDRIPAYRLSMGVTLPGVGPLAAFWRPLLDQPLTEAAGNRLVVDCRSATYQSAWVPRGRTADRTVVVRVLQERAGQRTVVSHLAKLTRGQVTRHLLQRDGPEPRTPQALAAAVAEAFACELAAPPPPGRPWTLDVIVHE